MTDIVSVSPRDKKAYMEIYHFLKLRLYLYNKIIDEVRFILYLSYEAFITVIF